SRKDFAENLRFLAQSFIVFVNVLLGDITKSLPGIDCLFLACRSLGSCLRHFPGGCTSFWSGGRGNLNGCLLCRLLCGQFFFGKFRCLTRLGKLFQKVRKSRPLFFRHGITSICIWAESTPNIAEW